MRVALVYDRLNKIGGAEHILTAFRQLYPDAEWYTSVWDPAVAPFSRNWNVHASWLNRVPILRRHHEWIPYLMPFVFESFNFSPYDLVISIGSAECKGIITRPRTPHLHYCLTPTRYLYSHRDTYLTNPLHRSIARLLIKWDMVAATRPDVMISISNHVKNRVKKYYFRDSDVIYPPVDTARFMRHPQLHRSMAPKSSNYYLIVSRLVAYKNIDLAIHAFNLSGRRLVIAGEGKELSRLQALAQSNITFAGKVDDDKLVELYRGCRAFIQCNEEDFGIAMVEAQAAGKPVIAYSQGGAVEIVTPHTGVLYNEPSIEALNNAIKASESQSFDAAACSQSALRFDKVKWIKRMKKRIGEYVKHTQ